MEQVQCTTCLCNHDELINEVGFADLEEVICYTHSHMHTHTWYSGSWTLLGQRSLKVPRLKVHHMQSQIRACEDSCCNRRQI